jgi:hypothetical protein
VISVSFFLTLFLAHPFLLIASFFISSSCTSPLLLLMCSFVHHQVLDLVGEEIHESAASRP